MFSLIMVQVYLMQAFGNKSLLVCLIPILFPNSSVGGVGGTARVEITLLVASKYSTANITIHFLLS